jgi:hypothetical protein
MQRKSFGANKATLETRSQEVKHHDWLNPLNKLVLITAFRDKKKSCALDLKDGRVEFVIDYDERDGYAWVTPKDGATVPCGWFELERSSSSAWLT